MYAQLSNEGISLLDADTPSNQKGSNLKCGCCQLVRDRPARVATPLNYGKYTPMKTVSYFFFFLIGVLLTFAILRTDRITGPATQAAGSSAAALQLTYTDFVTVMFTGATLVLTGVALSVALVAFFTYKGIIGEARRTIRDAVAKEMETLEARIEKEVGEEAEEKITRAIERAGHNGSLDRALERALVAIGQGSSKLTGELEADFALEEDEER